MNGHTIYEHCLGHSDILLKEKKHEYALIPNLVQTRVLRAPFEFFIAYKMKNKSQLLTFSAIMTDFYVY